MYLIAGLGNPGRDYADHRHNIGFMVADALAVRFRLGTWKAKFGAELCAGEAHGHRIALVKPMQFMNLSGPPVQQAAAFYQVAPKDIIVLHDELDLDFGRLKVKVGGGHGGHNGLRSLTEQIGPAFVRVRLGIGHPGHKDRVVGHVLGGFSKPEQKELGAFLDAAVEVVDSIVSLGVVPAMNKWNTSPAGLPPAKPPRG